MNAKNDGQGAGPSGGQSEVETADTRSPIVALVSDASDTAREALDAARSSIADEGGTIGARPLTTVLGGVALGILLGALLPRTERETALFGSLGARVQDGAREAADAAKRAGQQKFADFGLDRHHARDTARGFIEEILASAASAGMATFKSHQDRTGADRQA